MGRKDGIVWLYNTGCDLRRRIDGKLKLGFLGVVNSQTFKKEGTESRSSAATERMEHENTLETVTYAELGYNDASKRGNYKHQQGDLSSP